MSKFAYDKVMLATDAVLHEAHELEAWERMAPVGHEFGSPDYERLDREDFESKTGAYSPAVLKFARSHS